jgi:type IV fimbrial biogenesis protein FimT
LVEIIATLVVMSALLGVALPSLSDMMHAARLRGAADNLVAYLRYAMAESVKRNRSVSVTFGSAEDGVTWCYGMSEATDCDCGMPGSCVYDGVERIVTNADYQGVNVSVAVSLGRFAFQPRRNTVTAGNVTFTAANDKALRIVVSGYGRIRSCSPPGAANLAGYPLC